MAIAKIFRSGNSQAVRLPKDFRFDTTEVEIFRRGREVVLTEREPSDMRRAVELLLQLSDDLEAPDDPPPQERDWN